MLIKTLDELLDSRVHPFPTRAAELRVVRMGHGFVGVGRTGRIFATSESGTGREFRRLRHHGRAFVARGLAKLGVLTPEVEAGLAEAARVEACKEDARSVLYESARAERVGVPFTAEQLRALRELAGVRS
jgi:photosystem II stability/assembly factor-like uncharacterized protein